MKEVAKLKCLPLLRALLLMGECTGNYLLFLLFFVSSLSVGIYQTSLSQAFIMCTMLGVLLTPLLHEFYLFIIHLASITSERVSLVLNSQNQNISRTSAIIQTYDKIRLDTS